MNHIADQRVEMLLSTMIRLWRRVGAPDKQRPGALGTVIVTAGAKGTGEAAALDFTE